MSAAADACRYLSQCPLQSNWRPGPVRQQAAHKRSAWFGHQLPASKAPWFRSLKSLCRVPESGQARSRATPVSDCRAPALAGHENFGEIMGVSSRRPQVGIGRRAKICRAADGKRTHGKRTHGRAGTARITDDLAERERLAVGDRVPDLATVVTDIDIELRDSAALARACAWPAPPAPTGLSAGRIASGHLKLAKSVGAKLAGAVMSVPGLVDRELARDYKKNLY